VATASLLRLGLSTIAEFVAGTLFAISPYALARKFPKRQPLRQKCTASSYSRRGPRFLSRRRTPPVGLDWFGTVGFLALLWGLVARRSVMETVDASLFESARALTLSDDEQPAANTLESRTIVNRSAMLRTVAPGPDAS
jgi:hypothetical protein